MESSARGDTGARRLDFRVLGPVEVHDLGTGARIVPSGAKQRALLAALVVRAGEVLSVERLVAELWGDAPPTAAANALQAHVARLRRLLGGGAGRGGRQWIDTYPVGYLLRLGRSTTDAQRFHRLSAEGRAMSASDPDRAAELLRTALDLWRGPALEGSGHGPICLVEADRLEETRLSALEARHEAALRSRATGGAVIDELERLTAAHPLRERFYELLMAALYRSGRHAEALGVYERARRQLRDELGVEPGPALRGRMESILHHSPATAGPETAVLDLGAEITRLRAQVERLTRDQETLVRRLDLLNTPSATVGV